MACYWATQCRTRENARFAFAQKKRRAVFRILSAGEDLHNGEARKFACWTSVRLKRSGSESWHLFVHRVRLTTLQRLG